VKSIRARINPSKKREKEVGLGARVGPQRGVTKEVQVPQKKRKVNGSNRAVCERRATRKGNRKWSPRMAREIGGRAFPKGAR